MKWWVRYDARKPWAQRYGLCRVVEAEDAAGAQHVIATHEDGWDLAIETVRPATAVQIARQETIEHWLTLAKQGGAGRWMGL